MEELIYNWVLQQELRTGRLYTEEARKTYVKYIMRTDEQPSKPQVSILLKRDLE